ncbi:hypothetical protein RND81_05G127100 [Saponaria officinalis]|uniref:Translation initiation factor beta propellor-like domain-containing protein n=1 Tax=Saponaria officinalis TaxID=3572 RepID=A0AAW1KYF2_SAPOF
MLCGAIFPIFFVVFWDCEAKKQLGTAKAEWSFTNEWSPNGCYFMTASTAPRRQVDNGLKIFHHNGSLFFHKMFDKLFQVDWKPESAERFGDIAELGKSVASLKIEEGKSEGQGSKVFPGCSQNQLCKPSSKTCRVSSSSCQAGSCG